MFGSRIPLKTMSVLCRSLSTMLHSGVAIFKTLEISARKTGNARCREVLAAVTRDVEQGSDLSSALRNHGRFFPDLFIDMVDVAEQSGSLPEVLAGLGDHYDNVLRLRRSFIASITWPAIQLVAAILIVALLILVMGLIAESRPGQPATDMLGWGLSGPSGALKWLAVSFGSIFGILAAYFIAAKVFNQQRFLDSMLLHVPVVGQCMRSFAIARFSWAYSLTQQAGMPIGRSIEASFRATGNGAFMGASQQVTEMVMQGQEVSVALDAVRLFPDDYLHMVQVAETTGTIPEMLQKLSPEFESQARRSLSALAAVMGWVVWLIVAGLIVFVIFSIFLKYVGMINDLSKGI